MDSLLAIDSGQTAIRVQAADGGFRHSYPGVRTHSALLPQLADVIRSSVESAGHPFAHVAVGTSGLSEAEADPGALLARTTDLGVRSVLLAHDSITSYLGALGNSRGVVVAAGTGVVTLAVGRSRVSRVDGWGHIMGDAGSGYWIGRAGFDAVMRAYDGRGPSTALTEFVRGVYPDLEQAYVILQNDPDRIRVVGQLARQVAALAPSDAVAAEICRTAGLELALSASTAARNVGEELAPRIALIGGMFSSDAVRDSCVADLRRRWPGFEPAAPLGDGLLGALTLPQVGQDSPLHPMIFAAGRPDSDAPGQ